jgi:oligoendopeptidase F
MPTTWNLKPLFDGDDDPRIEEGRASVRAKADAFVAKWRDRTDYLIDPTVLAEALDEYEAWMRTAGTDGDEGYYIWLRSQQDESNPAIKARLGRVRDFAHAIQNDIRFFLLRIERIDPPRHKEFLSDPKLLKYRHFLEMLFAGAQHSLSEPEERIMTMKEPSAHDQWVTMVSGFLSREERSVRLEDGTSAVKNFSEIASRMDHMVKRVRDSAAEAFNNVLHDVVDAAEAEMNAILYDKKTDDELRGFSRPDAARHLSDDIDSDIVDMVIGTVADRFDISQRYYRLKAALMGVPKLEYHERNVPYGHTEKEYQFQDALELVHRVFDRLDPVFGTILRGFADEGRFDVYPQKGKHGGAFCVYGLLTHPIYILLNHTSKLRDVLTLAHELGHGINDTLMKNAQHALSFGTPLSTAEVASTFMEDFILQEMLAEADDELRFGLMIAKLNDDVSTIFRQTACYRFEQELHALFRSRGYLSKEDIGALFQKHMAAYMGDAVVQSPGSENWWVYWSHIRSFFYVYSYVSGLLISKTMQDSVKRDPAFIEKVKEFLSTGHSDSPRAIFGRMGIDISRKEFWKEGIGEIEKLLDDTEALAKKLGKLPQYVK